MIQEFEYDKNTILNEKNILEEEQTQLMNILNNYIKNHHNM